MEEKTSKILLSSNASRGRRPEIWAAHQDLVIAMAETWFHVNKAERGEWTCSHN